MRTINLPVAAARRWIEHVEEALHRLDTVHLLSTCAASLRRGLTTATGAPTIRRSFPQLPPPRQWANMSAQVALDPQARRMTVRLEVPTRHAGEAVIRATWRTLAIAVFGPENDTECAGPISYRRAIPLPAQADPDSVSFHFEGDYLLIHMQLMPARRPPLRARSHEASLPLQPAARQRKQPARRRRKQSARSRPRATGASTPQRPRQAG